MNTKTSMAANSLRVFREIRWFTTFSIISILFFSIENYLSVKANFGRWNYFSFVVWYNASVLSWLDSIATNNFNINNKMINKVPETIILFYFRDYHSCLVPICSNRPSNAQIKHMIHFAAAYLKLLPLHINCFCRSKNWIRWIFYGPILGHPNLLKTSDSLTLLRFHHFDKIPIYL